MNDLPNKNVHQYLSNSSDELKIIRSILLFGKNSYTYKFAFCDALLKIGPRQVIHQDQIFEPFLDALIPHVKSNPKQFSTSDSTPSEFMKACREYAEGIEPSKDKVLNLGAKIIPKNVFEAFQNIGGGRLSNENLLYEFDKKTKTFSLRPALLKILSDREIVTAISTENQGRWRVVEEAWKVGISPGLISFRKEDEKLYLESNNLRVPLRSAVDHLMPYQGGRCFYCNKKLNRFTTKDQHDFPDVDHFYSLEFLSQIFSNLVKANPNGIWNLVLACMECNRGENGKFGAIATNDYLEKIIQRNKYYSEEHKHAFRYAVLQSLGVEKSDQIEEAMKRIDREVLTIRWKPKRMSF